MPHIEIVVAESDDFPQYEMIVHGGQRQFLDRRQIQAESRKNPGMARIQIGDLVIDQEKADPRPMTIHDREIVATMIYSALPDQRDE